MGNELIWTIIICFGGIGVGSLLNTCIFRIQKNIPLKHPACCTKCMAPIHWIDKIPIISFFNLRGRCRNCSEVIAWQYPVVEMMTGIIFGLLFVRAIFGFGFFGFEDQSEWLVVFARDAIIASLLIVIFVYDYKYSVILDRFSLPAIFVAIVFNLALGMSPVELLLASLCIGGFFGFQFLISQGKWIGAGDIRMGLLIGALFGIKLGIAALLLSYIIGAMGGILLLITKQKTLQSHVPFGTFISIAIITTLFYGQFLVDWYIGML